MKIVFVEIVIIFLLAKEIKVQTQIVFDNLAQTCYFFFWGVQKYNIHEAVKLDVYAGMIEKFLIHRKKDWEIAVCLGIESIEIGMVRILL